jgi:DNA-binding NtrC family response regulator
MPEPILLVEDTPGLRHLYAALLRKEGYAVDGAETAAEALAAHAAGRHQVVLLDLMLPDGDGIDVLRAMRRDMPDVRAIVVTAHGSVNRAVDAMRAGAHDFLVKPFDENRLLRAVEAAVAAGGARAAPAPVDSGAPAGFIGAAPAMLAVYDMIREVARSSATVFITGESGTGKEVCAQAVHALSPRRAGPFVPLNCGAIPRDLLESEVFGHVKGSFTGAIADKLGAAAAADGGTLFLDEICEMDLELQTKLLRFLQTSTIQPVGVVTPRKVDVRIVCATNRDPEAEVAAGRFRADLFYRLFVVPVRLPPLRERGRDVLAIAERLLAQYAREEGKRLHRLDPAVEDAFLRYGWPGNIRELQNVMRQIVVLKDGEAVTLDMLPVRVIDGRRDAPVAAAHAVAPDVPMAESLAPEGYQAHLRALVGLPLDRVERDLIEATITLCDGSIPRAARLLEVSPSTLYRKREAWTKR